ncbi:MAG: division/cell wall cluster transcriptional repressor MraZ [Candidatus Woesebacteria bacterium]|jgi:MraZ protein
MLIGKFYHNLEEKGRLILPKKFRQKAKNWVITRGLDGCLFLFKIEEFQKQLSKLSDGTFTKKAQRDLARLMANEAENVNADKHGRLKIPEYLINFAQLKKEIVIIGSYARIEIWDRSSYHQYMDQIENEAEKIAESIAN